MIRNLDELWVGDRVLVKSVGEVGTFEKKVNKNTAIIKFEIGTSEIHIEDMELAGDKPIGSVKNNDKKNKKSIKVEEESASFEVLQKASFSNEIDLHFEKLAPNKTKADVANVLDFQLKCCRQFIEDAIQLNESDIKIIHGKGDGILRAAVMDLLNEYRENIYWDFPGDNKGGAISVLLK